jgi:hypothetical protein
VFPPIEASARTARPGRALSTREAADLVRDKALLLKASGFGVCCRVSIRLNVRLRLRGARERTRRGPTASACSTSTAGRPLAAVAAISRSRP